jgi:hypothetical protein
MMEKVSENFPFNVEFSKIQADPEPYVNSIFSCLESEFLIMPKGQGLIEFSVFEQGYEALKKATENFSRFTSKLIVPIILQTPVAFVVLRSILGFTPPELAYVASQHSNTSINQGFARTLDRKARFRPLIPMKVTDTTGLRLTAMVDTACHLLEKGSPVISDLSLHRLDKADTRDGLVGIKNMASMGVPYAMLLYERFLGRPFAGHRDSVSELVGDSLEIAIEEFIIRHGISYRKTKRAEKIAGFDQTPDFIVPSEFNPQVIIEAKITEDDGTARDKATRIQHLGELSLKDSPRDQPKFEVIACIGGRGFGVRREDMKKILFATRGKVFTMQTLPYMVANTRLYEFKTQ